jgi:hypothetical protein
MPEWKGVLATQRGRLDRRRLVQLRQAGLGYSIQIEGRTFSPPRLGVSTSGHATRIVVKAIQPSLKGNSKHFPPPQEERLTSPVAEAAVDHRSSRAALGIRLRDDGCLVLYEKTRAIDLPITMARKTGNRYFAASWWGRARRSPFSAKRQLVPCVGRPRWVPIRSRGRAGKSAGACPQKSSSTTSWRSRTGTGPTGWPSIPCGIRSIPTTNPAGLRSRAGY